MSRVCARYIDMDAYSFIATVLLVLVETRAASYKNVEFKFGSNSIIIPLKNDQPVHVTRIKGLNFVDLNVPIPDLVELILQSRVLPTVRPPTQHKSLASDRQVSSEEYTTPNAQSEYYTESNLADSELSQTTKHLSSTPPQEDATTEHYLEDEDENENVESSSQSTATNIKDHLRESNNTNNQNSQPDDVRHKYIKNYVTYEDILTNKTTVNKYLEMHEYRKIVNHINNITEEERSPVPAHRPTTEYVTKHSTPKFSNSAIDFTSTSQEDDFSSDLITSYVKKTEDSHHRQALEKDEASNHKVTSYTTELTTESSLQSDRRIENKTTLLENTMTTNHSQTLEEDSLTSHHTSKLQNNVDFLDHTIGLQDDAVTSLSTTLDNYDISLETTTKLPISEGTKKSLPEDQTTATDVSDTSLESQYITTVAPTLYTLYDLPLHDYSTRTPASMSSSRVLTTTTNVPEISSLEFSEQETYTETNAPETSRPILRTTTVSSELYTSTNSAAETSSIGQNTTDSSNENTSTILPGQGTSTELPLSLSSAPPNTTDVLKAISTASATNTSSPPASTTAAPLSSVRSTTVTTRTSTKRPQQATTKSNKKGVAKRRRKTKRQPCKGRLNKKGQKGKPGPGGRRRRRKTTLAARRTTRPSNIQRSTIKSSTVSSTTTPNPTTIAT